MTECVSATTKKKSVVATNIAFSEKLSSLGWLLGCSFVRWQNWLDGWVTWPSMVWLSSGMWCGLFFTYIWCNVGKQALLPVLYNCWWWCSQCCCSCGSSILYALCTRCACCVVSLPFFLFCFRVVAFFLREKKVVFIFLIKLQLYEWIEIAQLVFLSLLLCWISKLS